MNDGDLAGQRFGVDAGAGAGAPIEPFGEQVGDLLDELDVEMLRRPAFEPVAQRHQRLFERSRVELLADALVDVLAELADHRRKIAGAARRGRASG